MSSVATSQNQNGCWSAAAAFLLIPEDGQLHEVINGELLFMPPPELRHQEIIMNLAELLHYHVRRNRLGRIYMAPTDVVLGENVVRPDLLFISDERSTICRPDRVYGAPDLIIEVLSFESAFRDLQDKWRLYAQHNVREYWIVDPAKENVRVLHLVDGDYQPYKLSIPHPFRVADTVIGSSLLDSFQADCTDVFA